jgi:hypothetical protein
MRKVQPPRAARRTHLECECLDTELPSAALPTTHAPLPRAARTKRPFYHLEPLSDGGHAPRSGRPWRPLPLFPCRAPGRPAHACTLPPRYHRGPCARCCNLPAMQQTQIAARRRLRPRPRCLPALFHACLPAFYPARLRLPPWQGARRPQPHARASPAAFLFPSRAPCLLPCPCEPPLQSWRASSGPLATQRDGGLARGAATVAARAGGAQGVRGGMRTLESRPAAGAGRVVRPPRPNGPSRVLRAV